MAVALAVFLLLQAGGARLEAQIPDARVIPKGSLRITFATLYTNYDSRFALGSTVFADGDEEPLGADLTVDALGANVFPTLLGPTLAIRELTGDSTFDFNMGSLFTDLDGDIRIFPFDFALGVSDRLTIHARLPIITTRVNSYSVLDTTDADAGWNQLAPEAGNTTARTDAEMLLTDLLAAADFVDAQIAGGAFGCPGGITCTDAQQTVDRARIMAMSLGTMTGLSGGPLPPGAPLETSTAGAAILANISGVIADLTGLGAPAVGGSLHLPAQPIPLESIGAILGSDSFGYGLFPLVTTKLSRFGDLEIGFRYLVLNRRSVRAVVRSLVRLPTGTLDATNHVLDIGTGDRQTDVEAGLEVVYATRDRLGVSVAASYTLQMSHTRFRRVTRPDRPIAIAADEALVSRSPGNIMALSVHPWLQLGEGVKIFATASYYNKGSDTYSSTSPFTSVSGATVEDLGLESANTTWSFGGGLAYRSTRNGRNVPQLPIEAGFNYQSAFSGSGGATPKFNRLNLYLRLYYRIFGGS